MAKTYRKIITVRGSFRFPLDMLRYDHAWPRTERDSSRMQATIDDPTLPPVDVELLSDNMPNTERWRSFSWEVVRVERLV